MANIIRIEDKNGNVREIDIDKVRYEISINPGDTVTVEGLLSETGLSLDDSGEFQVVFQDGTSAILKGFAVLLEENVNENAEITALEILDISGELLSIDTYAEFLGAMEASAAGGEKIEETINPLDNENQQEQENDPYLANDRVRSSLFTNQANTNLANIEEVDDGTGGPLDLSALAPTSIAFQGDITGDGIFNKVELGTDGTITARIGLPTDISVGDTITINGIALTITAADIAEGSVPFEIEPNTTITATITDQNGNTSDPIIATSPDIDISVDAPTGIDFLGDTSGDNVFNKDEVGSDNSITARIGLPNDTQAGDVLTINGEEIILTDADITNGYYDKEVALDEDVSATIRDAAGNVSDPVNADAPVYDLEAIVKNDIAATTEDDAVIIDVLANDEAGSTITSVEVPTNAKGEALGTVEIITVDGKQQIKFTPSSDFNALSDGQTEEVQFTYLMKDPAGNENSATVDVTVNGVNDAATIEIDDSSLVQFTEENASAGDKVADFTTNDEDGDAVTVTVAPTQYYAVSGDTVVLTQAGANLVNEGGDLPQFTVSATDGEQTTPATDSATPPPTIDVNDAATIEIDDSSLVQFTEENASAGDKVADFTTNDEDGDAVTVTVAPTQYYAVSGDTVVLTQAGANLVNEGGDLPQFTVSATDGEQTTPATDSATPPTTIDVNDAATIEIDDSSLVQFTEENASAGDKVADFTTNDEDGDAVTVTVAPTQYYAVSGDTVVLTQAGANLVNEGGDLPQFTVSATDGEQTTPATDSATPPTTIDVNDAATIEIDDSSLVQFTEENASAGDKVADFTTNDEDGDAVTVTVAPTQYYAVSGDTVVLTQAGANLVNEGGDLPQFTVSATDGEQTTPATDSATPPPTIDVNDAATIEIDDSSLVQFTEENASAGDKVADFTTNDEDGDAVTVTVAPTQYYAVSGDTVVLTQAGANLVNEGGDLPQFTVSATDGEQTTPATDSATPPPTIDVNDAATIEIDDSSLVQFTEENASAGDKVADFTTNDEDGDAVTVTVAPTQYYAVSGDTVVLTQAGANLVNEGGDLPQFTVSATDGEQTTPATDSATPPTTIDVNDAATIEIDDSSLVQFTEENASAGDKVADFTTNDEDGDAVTVTVAPTQYYAVSGDTVVLTQAGANLVNEGGDLPQFTVSATDGEQTTPATDSATPPTTIDVNDAATIEIDDSSLVQFTEENASAGDKVADFTTNDEDGDAVTVTVAPTQYYAVSGDTVVLTQAGANLVNEGGDLPQFTVSATDGEQTTPATDSATPPPTIDVNDAATIEIDDSSLVQFTEENASAGDKVADFTTNDEDGDAVTVTVAPTQYYAVSGDTVVLTQAGANLVNEGGDLPQFTVSATDGEQTTPATDSATPPTTIDVNDAATIEIDDSSLVQFTEENASAGDKVADFTTNDEDGDAVTVTVAPTQYYAVSGDTVVLTQAGANLVNEGGDLPQFTVSATDGEQTTPATDSATPPPTIDVNDAATIEIDDSSLVQFTEENASAGDKVADFTTNDEDGDAVTVTVAPTQYYAVSGDTVVLTQAGANLVNEGGDLPQFTVSATDGEQTTPATDSATPPTTIDVNDAATIEIDDSSLVQFTEENASAGDKVADFTTNDEDGDAVTVTVAPTQYYAVSGDTVVLTQAGANLVNEGGDLPQFTVSATDGEQTTPATDSATPPPTIDVNDAATIEIDDSSLVQFTEENASAGDKVADFTTNDEDGDAVTVTVAPTQYYAVSGDTVVLTQAGANLVNEGGDLPQFTVSATDGEQTTPATDSATPPTTIDVNDAATIEIDDSSLVQFTEENASAGDKVADFTTNDEDGDAVTVTVAPTQYYAVSGDTVVLTQAGANLVNEGGDLPQFTVSATDGEQTTPATDSATPPTTIDVNDAATIEIDDSSLVQFTEENASAGDKVADFTTNDEDGDAVTVTVAPTQYYAVSGDTVVLTQAGANLVNEGGDLPQFTVSATDGEQTTPATDSATPPPTIDVNDAATIEIDDSSLVQFTEENASAGDKVADFTTNDEDGDAVTVTVAPTQYYAVSGDTVVLTQAGANLVNEGGDLPQFTVSATDGEQTTPATDSATPPTTIDVNDAATIEIDDSSLVQFTEENASAGDKVADFTTNDEDGDAVTVTVAPTQYYAVSGDTVVLTQAGANLVNEGGDLPQFTVSATDGEQTTPATDSATPPPTIDVNDAATIEIDDSSLVQFTEENASAGDKVADFTTNDEDGDAVTVTVAPTQYYAVSGDTVVLTQAGANLVNEGGDLPQFTVSATDGEQTTPATDSATPPTTIDVNDAATIEIDDSSLVQFTEENASAGDKVADFTTNDEDGDAVTVTVAPTQYYAVSGDTVVLTQAGADLVNEGGDLPQFTVSATDGEQTTPATDSATPPTTIDVNDNPDAVDDNGLVTETVLFKESFEGLRQSDGSAQYGGNGNFTGDNGNAWSATDSIESQRGIVTESSDGNAHVELDVDDNTAISTTIDTSNHENIKVEFDYKPRYDSSTSDMSFTVEGQKYVIDHDGGISPESDNVSITQNSNGWYTITATFTDVDDSIDLSFEGEGNSDSVGALLDNVKVSGLENSLETDEDNAITIEPATLLANDTDEDGDTLTITDVTATADTHGTVAIVDGKIVFTPDENYNGEATFTYTVSDGNGGTDTATVTVNVTPVNDASELTVVQTVSSLVQGEATQGLVIARTSTNDIDGDDVTVTLSDTINYRLNEQGEVELTQAGADLVNRGEDLPDYEVLATDGIQDTPTTVSVNPVDTFDKPDVPEITNITDTDGDMTEVLVHGTGEAGNTITLYDRDNNVLGTTTVQPNGTWTLDIAPIANDFNHFINATQTSQNNVVSEATPEVHTAQADWPNSKTQDFDDYVFTGSGNDSIKYDANDANDKIVIDGGDGSDTVTFENRTDDITVDLSDDQNETIGDDSLELRNVENIYGGSGNDTITGNDEANTLSGGKGNDTLSGGKGNDTLAGGEGNDTLIGGEGDDKIHGQNGDDTIIGGAGNDTIRTDGGTDTVVFSGNLEDYSFTYNPQTMHIIVTDNRPGSPDGTDDVYGAEFFQFGDVKVSTAIENNPAIDLVVSSDSGKSNEDNITNDSTPTVQIPLTAGVTAGYTVSLYSSEGKLVDYKVTQADVDNGFVRIETPEFTTDGDYTLSASISNMLGFEGAHNVEIDVTIDTQIGAVTADLDAQSDTGFENDDNITKDNTPTITGTADVGTKIEIFDGNVKVGEATVGADGTYSIETNTLNDGTHNLTVKSTDVAGNESETSQEVKVDTSINERHFEYNHMNEDGGVSGIGGNMLSLDESGAEIISETGTFVGEFGTLVIDENGEYTYKVNNNNEATQGLKEGELGKDVFSITVSDPAGNTYVKNITLGINGENDVVENLVDTDTSDNVVAENVQNGAEVGIDVNAMDKDGETITYSIVDSDGNVVNDGPFTIDSETGLVTVRDNTQIDFETSDSMNVTIKASSEDGSSVIKTFPIAVTDVDDTAKAATAIEVQGDTNNDGIFNKAELGEDGTITVNVKLPDDVQAGDTITINGEDTILTDAIITTGEVQAQALPNTEVTATITDIAGNVSKEISITTPNADIEAQTQNDSVQTGEDESVIIDVLANDETGSVINSVQAPTNSQGEPLGTVEIVTIDGKQQLKFTPADNFDALNEGQSEDVSFTYMTTDAAGNEGEANVTVEVQGQNNDLTYKSEAAAYKNVVGYYELDSNGDPISPATVVIDDQNGMQSGTHLSDMDPSKEYGFFVIADGANQVNNNSVVTVDASGNILIDGNTPTKKVFHDNPEFNDDGKDHFVMESDGNGGTNIRIEDLNYLGDADFQDTVMNLNYEIDDIIGNDVKAKNDTATVNEEDSVLINVLNNDKDATGDELSISKIQGQDVSSGQTVNVTVGGEVAGTARVINGKIEFTPGEKFDELNDGQNGQVTFNYTTTDGNKGEDTANVTVTVRGETDNEAPVAVDDSPTVENINIVKTGSNIDNLGNQGSNYRYGSNLPADVETQNFDFGAEYAGKTVTLTFNSHVTGGWEDGDNGETIDTFKIFSNGELLDTRTYDETHDSDNTWDSAHTYTVTLDENGRASVEFEVASTHVTELVDISNIEVTLNDQETTLTTDEDSAITVDVLANDSDADGNALTITEVQSPVMLNGVAVGTAAIVMADGKQQIQFTPNDELDKLDEGEAQNVSFTYTVSDGNGGTDTATTTIKVTGNDNDASTKVDHGLNLESNHAHIDVGNQPFKFTTEFTISQNVTNTGSGGILFNKENSYELAVMGDGSVKYALMNNSHPYTWYWTDTGYNLPAGEEHNITFSFDGDSNTVKLYVDGNEEFSGSQNVPDRLKTNNNELQFGERGYNNQDFEGNMDDIKIYDKALSNEQLEAVSNGEAVTDGLVAHYDFEGENPLADKSGNGNDAELSSGAIIEGNENDTIDMGAIDNKVVHAGEGDDTITIGSGQNQEAYGDEGDDEFIIEDVADLKLDSDNATKIQGGDDYDTMIFEDDISFDFAKLAENVREMEAIDLQNEQADTLREISSSDVLKITDEDNVLKILGDNGDTVGLDNNEGTWTKSDQRVTEEGETFDVWTNDDATVYIDTDIQVDI